ncbi:MAG: c-type cytochrome [Acidobacteria bacterium]|nr:c-type cytochrome [Acidobacteriota bacterium]
MACGIALGIMCLVGVSVWAQAPAGGGQQAPPPMTNLQVWPQNTSRAVVINFMNAFNRSLGVECNYCHVQREGRFDFASDDKREKKVARKMIMLRDSINVSLAAIVDKPVGAGPTSGEGRPGAPTRVLCASCHHGLPIPEPLGAVVSQSEANGGGAAAGLAKFKELRAKFYGGQQYDFTEYALVGIGTAALNAKRPDDALVYLQANLEYFPKSSMTYQGIAQVKNAKGDKQGAIQDLSRALELNPNNAQARNQLQQLKGQ